MITMILYVPRKLIPQILRKLIPQFLRTLIPQILSKLIPQIPRKTDSSNSQDTDRISEITGPVREPAPDPDNRTDPRARQIR